MDVIERLEDAGWGVFQGSIEHRGKGAVRKVAEAIRDPSPLYMGEVAAKKSAT